MRLRCVSRYRTAKLSVEVGQVLDLSEAEALALQADAPGCWEDADQADERHAAALAEQQRLEEEAAQLKAAQEQAEAERKALEKAALAEKALDKPPADKMIKGAPKHK